MQTRQLLQVMDDVLVILVSRSAPQWILAGLGMNMGLGGLGNEEETVVWNWKTGRVIAVNTESSRRLVKLMSLLSAWPYLKTGGSPL